MSRGRAIVVPLAGLSVCAAFSGSALGQFSGSSVAAGRVFFAQFEVVSGRAVERGRAAGARMNMLEMMCYPSGLPDEVRAEIEEATGFLPPTMAPGGERYIRDLQTWVGEAGLGLNFWAVPAHLTYSFAPDGASWGGLFFNPTGANTLNAELAAVFGDVDRGHEFLRQGLACYERFSGLRYDEVADDGSPMTTSVARSLFRGDIRIGGFDGSCAACLAWNAFPSGDGVSVEGGGDMCLNNVYWSSQGAYLRDPANNFRSLRNAFTHEHGHGTGAVHVVPCNQTKNMEPFLTTSFDMLQVDDRRGVQRSYGDRLAGNHSAAAAHPLGNLKPAGDSGRGAAERGLSTNASGMPNDTDEDWFSFSLGSAAVVSIRVTPIGGVYSAGQQNTGCEGASASIDASAAGNLSLSVHGADAGAALAVASGLPAGFEESVSLSLGTGTYFIRVLNSGSTSGANQYVQMYDLTVRADGALLPPYAKAGVNKRIAAGTACWFMGDINSEAQEPGAQIEVYEWDVDGDGADDAAGAGQVSAAFVSNGEYEARLRVTDTNGLSATDSIRVTVFGATTSIGSVTPREGAPGTIVPIVITGTNLKRVVASDVSVSGGGVVVGGVAQADGMGTVLAGLTLEISPGAGLGGRTLTIANADGTATLAGAFAVVDEPCGDMDGDGVVDFGDIVVVLNHTGQSGPPGTVPGDANDDGMVNYSDITYVLEAWGEICG